MQPNAKLLTRDGQLVHEFIMLPFRLMPEVCMWGSQVFVLKKPFEQEFDTPAQPIYYEACPWHVEASDYFMTRMPRTSVMVTINGKQVEMMNGSTNYNEVVVAAEMKGEPTIVWRNKTTNMDGSLSPGQTIDILGGEIFSVCHTGNA
jgi:hypothetical protein